MRAVKAAGFAVEDIDFVICTHLHVDPVGWNTRLEGGRWVPTFPKARYVFGKAEYDYWAEQHAKAEVPPFGDSVLPVVEARRPGRRGGGFSLAGPLPILAPPGHAPRQAGFCAGRAKSARALCGQLR